MKKGFPVKIADIAKKVNVSSVTVSKALRGHPDISIETAKKIKAVAKKLGYVPNFMARNLSSRNSNIIGVVVPKISHFFFSAVIEAIYDAAVENNYEIMLTVSQENTEREAQHIQTLLSMRVDGLIVSVSQQTTDYSIFETVRNAGIPLTFMDRVVDLKGANTVCADDRAGAFAATEQAIKVGYKKLAHLGGPLHTSVGRDRLRGFKDALKQYKLPLNPEFIIHAGLGEEDGYKGFMKLYSSGKLPDFIFTAGFSVAIGVYQAVQELGLNIPRDVDIISFGSSSLTKFLAPRLSVIEQPTSTLGRTALELTVANIRNIDTFKTQHIQLPTKLLLAETCVAKSAKHS